MVWIYGIVVIVMNFPSNETVNRREKAELIRNFWKKVEN